MSIRSFDTHIGLTRAPLYTLAPGPSPLRPLPTPSRVSAGKFTSTRATRDPTKGATQAGEAGSHRGNQETVPCGVGSGAGP